MPARTQTRGTTAVLHSPDHRQRKKTREAIEEVWSAWRVDPSHEMLTGCGGVFAKAAMVHALLMQRITDCSDAALLLREADRGIPYILMTRVVAESTIMLYGFRQKATEFAATRDAAQLEKFLLTGSLSSCRSHALDQACTVLMIVDRLDRECRGFKRLFNAVCESTDIRYDVALRTSDSITMGKSPRPSDAPVSDLIAGVAADLLLSSLTVSMGCSVEILRALSVAKTGTDRTPGAVPDRETTRHRAGVH
jgi:hypothetical protein